MNNAFRIWIVSICLLFCFSSFGQQTLQLEVAPYFVPCNQSTSDDCLQLLDINGSNLKVIPLDGIKGFTAEQGFEYSLDVIQIVANEENEQNLYVLKKETSKMWVPQFATDAPTLEGSFQVVGINGKSLNAADLTFVINANNSVMSGSTGCNNYHLFFKQFGYSLVFSKILASHMFCASRAAMEEEYFVIFNSVHHFELKGDVLRLYDITDRNLLEAVRI